MYDEIALYAFILVFTALGLGINHGAELLYWMWVDMRSREDD